MNPPTSPRRALRRLLLPALLVAAGGCATAPPRDDVFTRPVVLFVTPDSAEVAALKQEHGEENFYVAADDENWYRSNAFGLLDSLGVEHRVVTGRRFTFLVGGAPRVYDWTGEAAPWIVVLYDGRRAPRVTASVDLPAEVGFLTE